MNAAPVAEADELEIERLRADFPYFCERMLRINPKVKELVKGDLPSASEGPLIPFRWNKAQWYVWRQLCSQIERGLPVRAVVLKARQVGISTFVLALIFWHMWRAQYVRAGIVAYNKKVTLAALNETMNTFYANLPDGCKPKLRQHRKDGSGRITKEEVYFDDRKSSAAFVVQSPDALRGPSLQCVLATEVAFYKEAEEFFGSFLPTMDPSAVSVLVLESSPADGFFRDAYEDAKSGHTDRIALFIPWWMCDDLYSRPLTRKGRTLFDKATGAPAIIDGAMRAVQRKLSRDAKKRDLPAITDEQMWWWIFKCRSDYGGDEEFMRQEFPDDDESAFQRASRGAFKVSMEEVNRTVGEAEEAFPDMMAGTLDSATYTIADLEEQEVVFTQEPRPNYIDQESRPGLLMFQAPQPGYTYTIGADVADAEGEDDEEGERAFSVACVYCCDTHEQVAEWRGHLEPTEYGDELVKLGYFYNTALLCLERNNMGRLTEERVRVQLQYPARFRWPDFNVGPTALTKKEMWETNSTTKPLLIGMFRQWTREGKFRVRSAGLRSEMMNYAVKGGRFVAQHGCADRVIAAALCVQAVQQTDDFRYKAAVLGARGVVSRSAHGQAARLIGRTKPTSSREMAVELPAEFDGLGVSHVHDIFANAGY